MYSCCFLLAGPVQPLYPYMLALNENEGVGGYRSHGTGGKFLQCRNWEA